MREVPKESFSVRVLRCYKPDIEKEKGDDGEPFIVPAGVRLDAMDYAHHCASSISTVSLLTGQLVR